ncbi:M4 family peptidase [Pseudonocardiaceae bacterium YIM PH 21723]|nr:M4 family peptidase [Pseudonocardiaceae bacterium YIM PH 21723]
MTVRVVPVISIVCVLGALTTAALAGTSDPVRLKGRGTSQVQVMEKAAHTYADQHHLLIGKITPGPGQTWYVPLSRRHNGLAVLGADVVLVVDGTGRIRDVTPGDTPDTITLDTKATVPEEQAKRTALAQVKGADMSDTMESVVLMRGGAPTLAYAFDIWRSTGRAEEYDGLSRVWVDGHSGAALGKIVYGQTAIGQGQNTGRVTFDTKKVDGGFSMSDTTRPGLSCGKFPDSGKYLSRADDQWGATDTERACVDVLYAAQREWDMLGSWLDRKGFDGLGRGYPALVDWDQDNAGWSAAKDRAMFGRDPARGRAMTSIDIVGHEYGHAIYHATGTEDEYTDPESTGLSESTGDILGTLTEHFANNPADPPDFTIGEVVGPGPWRYMDKPSRDGESPDCWRRDLNALRDVHAAAGPQNHWFYLLAQGSANSPTCNGRPVTGIGIQKAGRVFISGLMRKTSTWNHAAARRATVASALELYGCPEVTAVRSAWDAISVPAGPTEPKGCA